ncbi:MAG: hypothetical protein WDN28_15960 [Chthoniobacter sp.]
MALFQLDPESIAARVRASSHATPPPTLASSLARGVLGFTVVSVAGFLPWPILDRWFSHPTEMELYLSCTAVFIGLSGPCLHRLIIGPGSLSRFYALFALAFIAYAVLWVTFWVMLRGDAGGLLGLLGGTAAMGAILALAFDHPRAMPKVIAALFVLNALGYYAGGKIEGKLAIDHRLVAMLLWGACYGIGFGAGLGAAFYFCRNAPALSCAPTRLNRHSNREAAFARSASTERKAVDWRLGDRSGGRGDKSRAAGSHAGGGATWRVADEQRDSATRWTGPAAFPPTQKWEPAARLPYLGLVGARAFYSHVSRF